jgi:hypothetical protein
MKEQHANFSRMIPATLAQQLKDDRAAGALPARLTITNEEGGGGGCHLDYVIISLENVTPAEAALLDSYFADFNPAFAF